MPKPRSRPAVARWAARALRRSVRVERHDHHKLVVKVQGDLGGQQVAHVSRVLTDVLSTGPEQAHIDLAGTDLIAGIGDVFVQVAAIAQARHTRVTVHRASTEQRAVLRRLGLDRILLYSDHAP